MQNQRDKILAYEENPFFELSVCSVLGDREEQQDGFGYKLRSDEGLVVVCDGMGGHSGGKLASSVSVNTIINNYIQSYPVSNIYNFLLTCVELADTKVASLTDESGCSLRAGSTVVAIVIRGHSLHWVSVGDSRIYLFRDDELVQATHDHTYQNLLDEQKARGEIDPEQYRVKSAKGDALISFLGANGLPRIDINKTPFTLQKGDRILLVSDGLYKLISDEEIRRILSNFNSVSDATNALEAKAQRASKNNAASRDNMTVSVIKIK